MDDRPAIHMRTLVVDENGHVHEEAPTHEIAPMLDLQGAHDAKWAHVRAQRAKLLADSDWVVMRAMEAGEPIPEEWRTYRQALRNLTLELNPFLIVWPQPPETAAPKRHIYTPKA